MDGRASNLQFVTGVPLNKQESSKKMINLEEIDLNDMYMVDEEEAKE